MADLYWVNKSYIDYLREVEPKVMEAKKGRMYVGILYKENDMVYLAPISSVKEGKDYQIENGKMIMLSNNKRWIHILRKDNGKGLEIYGKIQFNNMIPVPISECRKLDGRKKYTDQVKMEKIIIKNDDEQFLKFFTLPLFKYVRNRDRNKLLNMEDQIYNSNDVVLDLLKLEDMCLEWIERKQQEKQLIEEIIKKFEHTAGGEIIADQIREDANNGLSLDYILDKFDMDLYDDSYEKKL